MGPAVVSIVEVSFIAGKLAVLCGPRAAVIIIFIIIISASTVAIIIVIVIIVIVIVIIVIVIVIIVIIISEDFDLLRHCSKRVGNTKIAGS